jgi:hypothetical protein
MSLNGDTIYFNESLDSWCAEVHATLSAAYGTKRRLGRFAKSSHMSVIGAILSSATKDDILSSMRGRLDMGKHILICHSAWSNHYIAWKNTNESRSSIERDRMATTWIDRLDVDRRQLYQDIVEIVFNRLVETVLENCMGCLRIDDKK